MFDNRITSIKQLRQCFDLLDFLFLSGNQSLLWTWGKCGRWCLSQDSVHKTSTTCVTFFLLPKHWKMRVSKREMFCHQKKRCCIWVLSLRIFWWIHYSHYRNVRLFSKYNYFTGLQRPLPASYIIIHLENSNGNMSHLRSVLNSLHSIYPTRCIQTRKLKHRGLRKMMKAYPGGLWNSSTQFWECCSNHTMPCVGIKRD